MLQLYTCTIVTDGAGAGAASLGPITGKIVAITYTKDGSNGYTDGVDFAITTARSLQTVWTEANVNTGKQCNPRAATHSNAGVAATYDGTRAVLDKIALVDERLLFALTNGGAAKTGQFSVVVED